MPAEQARVHFDHAELHFTVDPAGQSIDASATLSFTAKSATDVLLLDLDRNLPISAIALDGQPLAATSWSNPDGRLRIALPAPLADRRQGDASTIRYGGKPHVAKTRAVGRRLRLEPHRAMASRGSPARSRARAATCSGRASTSRRANPTWSTPDITVPKTLAAPGNGVLVGITEEGDRHTWHWRAKHPNTYAIAINVGPVRRAQGGLQEPLRQHHPDAVLVPART